MIQRQISLSTTEKVFYDEMIRFISMKKKKRLSNEFSNRIVVLDKKGLKKINVFGKKWLCNHKKKYLLIYNPFLNGCYCGLIKKSFHPHGIINETKMAIKN